MFYLFFFFDVTPTTEIYTLSLHDALPILTVERLLSVINHVRAGVGIAILPWGVLPPAPWTGFHAATLAEPTLSVAVGLIALRGRYLTPAASSLMTMIQQETRQPESGAQAGGEILRSS